jgi:exonuclease SbcC
LNEQLLALKNKAASLPAEIERLKKELSGADEQINAEQEALHTLKTKREATFGTGDALSEKQETEKTLFERQQQIEAIQQEARQIRQLLLKKQTLKQSTAKLWQDAQNKCRQIEQQILNAAATAGFSSLEELQSSLLDFEQRRAIEQQRDAVDDEISRYTASMDTIQKEIAAGGLKEMAAESSVELGLQLQNALNQKDQLAAELSTASDRLEQHQTVEKEYQQKLRELEQQEKVCDQIHTQKRLFETVEDAESKMRIRELLLERLLEQSNRHLGNLSSRYCLKREQTTGLGVEIEDVFQQKSRRSINTLSGGESFLISLSLALGLSDMAANGRKMESLFIDEGFGCLDDDTLYNVLSALKDLKNNGKMVGVISHVKKVEEEIPTKIRITKMPGGVSRLDVVA